jgi:hypothetical protein
MQYCSFRTSLGCKVCHLLESKLVYRSLLFWLFAGHQCVLKGFCPVNPRLVATTFLQLRTIDHLRFHLSILKENVCSGQLLEFFFTMELSRRLTSVIFVATLQASCYLSVVIHLSPGCGRSTASRNSHDLFVLD